MSMLKMQEAEGSPPRMRGKRLPVVSRRKPVGITPAHAGKTTRMTSCALHARDHPRACGENLTAPRAENARRGSPPRMRGKQGQGRTAARAWGITPAHAGKTQGSLRRPLLKRDHPRACGENFLGLNTPVFALGSPPRMRGKHDRELQALAQEGITPAHAGKTGLRR